MGIVSLYNVLPCFACLAQNCLKRLTPIMVIVFPTENVCVSNATCMNKLISNEFKYYFVYIHLCVVIACSWWFRKEGTNVM